MSEFSPLKLVFRRNELNENCTVRLSHNEKRLTMGRAAEILGVHKSTLQRWESGAVNPRVDELSNIARCYGVAIDYFMI